MPCLLGLHKGRGDHATGSSRAGPGARMLVRRRFEPDDPDGKQSRPFGRLPIPVTHHPLGILAPQEELDCPSSDGGAGE